LIHSSPQIVILAFNSQKHFIHIPFVPGARTATTELVGILLAKLPTPFPNRLIRYDYPTFAQQLFDITKAQAEAKIQPHCVADDLYGKAMVLVACGRC
jgi:hypothetical protein